MTLVGANWPCMRCPNRLMSTVTSANCSLFLLTAAPGVELLAILSSAARDKKDKETSSSAIQLLVESLPMKAKDSGYYYKNLCYSEGHQEKESPLI